MQLSFDKLVSTVFPHYTFRVLGPNLSATFDSNRSQDDVMFDSDYGSKQLRLYEDQQQFQFDYAFSEYVAAHGYRRIPRMIRTKHGDPCVFLNDTWYVMTDSIQGRILTFSPEDILPLTRNLALLHHAIQGFPLPDITRATNLTWKEMMLAAVDAFHQTCEEWNRETNRLSRDAFQTHVLKHLEWYTAHAKSIEKTFRESLVDDSARCFGDVRLENYRIGSNGKVYLTEYLKPYADTPVYDLAKLCLFALEQGHPDAIPDILNEYHSVREISSSEADELRSYLAFPHTNWKLLYLYKRRRGSAAQIAELAEQEFEKNKNREGWLKEVFSVSK